MGGGTKAPPYNILILFILRHPFQILIISAVAVNDGAVGLEGNDPVYL